MSLNCAWLRGRAPGPGVAAWGDSTSTSEDCQSWALGLWCTRGLARFSSKWKRVRRGLVGDCLTTGTPTARDESERASTGRQWMPRWELRSQTIPPWAGKDGTCPGCPLSAQGRPSSGGHCEQQAATDRSLNSRRFTPLSASIADGEVQCSQGGKNDQPPRQGPASLWAVAGGPRVRPYRIGSWPHLRPQCLQFPHPNSITSSPRHPVELLPVTSELDVNSFPSQFYSYYLKYSVTTKESSVLLSK